MKVPYLKKKLELKSCHNIHGKIIIAGYIKKYFGSFKDKTKLDPEVKNTLMKKTLMQNII